MCGIFGVICVLDGFYPAASIHYHIDRLFVLSESRGKEASGLAINNLSSIEVLKDAIPASKLIKSQKYRDLIHRSLAQQKKPDSLSGITRIAVLGHSRLVTNGTQELDINNQPVIKDGAVGVHNGIIVNDHQLWEKYPDLTRLYEVDTEILFAMIRRFQKNGDSLVDAVKKAFLEIQGSASIAVFFDDMSEILLATNTGSLYVCENNAKNLIVFGSERYILKQLISDKKISRYWDGATISQIEPFTGCLINIKTLQKQRFLLSGTDVSENPAPSGLDPYMLLPIVVHAGNKASSKSIPGNPTGTGKSPDKNRIIRMISDQRRPDTTLRRCTKCILPATFPSIEFDENGVCNYCRDHKKFSQKGRQALEEIVAPFRKQNGEQDCIVGFSGGRDSSYLLHYVKNELKMHPIAYTYDWGMVTDLARRNQARMCGKLGIEHILISADIEKKRENIRKNIHAWLYKPSLGMVPLLMAGDKQFYYFAHELLAQTGVKIIFNGGNPFEVTNFKLGFCGIDQGSQKQGGKILTGISKLTKLKLLFYYAKQYLLNPAYINSSLFDTLHAYYSSYVLPDVYVYFFDYIPWDEQEIVFVIREEYDWELARDTDATWRIGDGTAAFYDYIYYTVAGFSEFDTFRSHQIREGLITREAALNLVAGENIPRYEALEWYAQTIGFDLEYALNVIHIIPKLY